jgi:hypothetical protein
VRKQGQLKLTEIERALFQKLGRRGGKKRTANMTPEERSKAARKAVNARWAKRGSKNKAA